MVRIPGVVLALLFLLPGAAAAQLTLVPYASGFEKPLGMVQDPVDPTEQYVLEKYGRIWVLKNGVRLPDPFLDITAEVWKDAIGERGLLGLAFPPDAAISGRAFIFYSSLHGLGGDSVVARYKRSAANRYVLDPASRFELEWSPGERYISQPSGIHKGGKITFGPDGYLYVPVGDGGPLLDPFNQAQDVNLLLGKILRVDVNVPDEDPVGYRIPPTNPFVNGEPAGARPQIWALGLRNPWRVSFDDPVRGGTGAILIADVGQDLYEEINYAPAGAGGRNFGWSLSEGPFVAEKPEGTPPPLVLPIRDPIFAYLHSVEWGSSITGGHVYRGPNLGVACKGRYFFTDFIGRRLFSMPITLQNGTKEAEPVLASAIVNHTDEVGGQAAVGRVASIDVDAQGELYLVDHTGGRILKLVMDSDEDALPDGWEAQFGLNALSALGHDGATGDPDGDGRTNAQEFAAQTHPSNVAPLTRYLAEGSASSFFETTIGIANPGTLPASVLLRFLRNDGLVIAHALTVPAKEHATVRPGDLVGLSLADFATVIETDQLVVVERTMTWTPVGRYGSHAERAVTAPSTAWYLAEGATHGAFDTFYLLENPGETTADVEIAYLLPTGAPIVQRYALEQHARRTIWVDAELPALSETDVSARITVSNSVPIIVERAMYRSGGGTPFAAGHASAGVTAPSTHWFFAEGATGGFFDLYLLLANPGMTGASVSVKYLLPEGAPVQKTYMINPESRTTISVKGEDKALADTAVAMVVESSMPIVAERSMYWPSDNWIEAHNSPGATETGTSWVVAGAEQGGAYAAQTFVLIANTSAAAGSARVTLLREHYPPLVRTFPLPADSRTNVDVGAILEFAPANDSHFGVLVESLGAGPTAPAQIVVEHATYSSDANGTFWAAGSNTIATRIQ